MKKSLKILSLILFMVVSLSLYSQNPLPPGVNGSHEGGNEPVGGGAPLGGGITILLAVAGAYGFMKYKKKTPDYTVME